MWVHYLLIAVILATVTIALALALTLLTCAEHYDEVIATLRAVRSPFHNFAEHHVASEHLFCTSLMACFSTFFQYSASHFKHSSLITAIARFRLYVTLRLATALWHSPTQAQLD